MRRMNYWCAVSLLALALAAGCGPSGTPVTVGQPVQGELAEGDNVLPDDDSLYDEYVLEAEAGETYTISMTSNDFDAYLLLLDSAGDLVNQNDDMGDGSTNAQIVQQFDEAGSYVIYANSYQAGETGSYTLTVEGGSGAGGGEPEQGEEE